MKKSLLIVLDSLKIGGEEKSALAMLSCLNPQKYDVTLMLYHRMGLLLGEAPEWVRIEDVPLTDYGLKERELGRKKALVCAVSRFDVAYLMFAFCRLIKLFVCGDRKKLLLESVISPSIRSRHFDVAMCYCSCREMQYFVATSVCARSKVFWVHCEIGRKNRTSDVPESLLKCYDKIAIASSSVMCREVKTHYPHLAERVVNLPLLMDRARILALANESKGIVSVPGVTSLFSAGRLTDQKGFDMALEVLATLKNEGHQVVWYIAGDGEDREALSMHAQTLGLLQNSDIVFLGAVNNPYPYFKTCDIYVQPSRYEGYCLTLAEARFFHKPIVCTDFAGAFDQVVSGETAFVVKFDKGQLVSAISRMISEPETRRRLSENLMGEDRDSSNEWEMAEFIDSL